MATGIIILAAGASTRLGRPKQLLLFKDRTLISIAVDAAVNSGCSPIAVVTGAYEKEILSSIADQTVAIVNNPHWETGMSSSIKSGLSLLLQLNSEIEQVLIMLCDQPYINAEILNQLIRRKTETSKGIIATFYNNTAGAPVLFDKRYLPQLLLLQGQEGAKKLLLKHPEDVETVRFDLGAIDIDTAHDYEQLTQRY